MGGLSIRQGEALIDRGQIHKELRSEPFTVSPGLMENQKGIQGESFGQKLSEAIGSVNELQKTADKRIEGLATGQDTNIAEVMMAVEKADIALRLMVQVRNKMIESYQEIMRMQV